MVRRPLALVGLATLILTSCGPAARDTVQTGAEQAKADLEASRATSCEPGKEPWRGQGTPVRGNTLMRAHQSFEHLDWSKGTGAAAGAIAQMYNGLVQLRGCDFQDNALVPSLAKAWDISTDGLTYTVKLRDDVKWHNKPPVNGRKFTAADVAFTMEHQKAEGVLRSFWEDVKVEIPDPYTIVMRKPQPDADFIEKWGEYRNVIFPKEVKEQHGDYRTVAVGTGAFMMKEYRVGQFVIAEKNPDYYEKGDDGRALPYLDGYQSTVFSDYTAEVAALRTGQIDTVRFSGLRKTEADVLRQTNPSLRFYTQERFSNSTLWFNLKKKPWDDYRVRKAAQLAIDREDLIAMYQGAAANAGFLPPAFKEYLWTEEKLKERFKPDLEQAKKLMAEAGIPPGSLNVSLVTGAPYAQASEIIAERLKAIGILTSIDVRGDSFTPILQKGDLKDLGSVQFVNYWASDIVRSNSNNNYVGFSDPKADQLAEAQGREAVFEKRKAIVDQQQDRLYELMPWVPTVSEQYNRFESCRLRNSPKISPNYNPRSVVHAWLDPTGC